MNSAKKSNPCSSVFIGVLIFRGTSNGIYRVSISDPNVASAPVVPLEDACRVPAGCRAPERAPHYS